MQAELCHRVEDTERFLSGQTVLMLKVLCSRAIIYSCSVVDSCQDQHWVVARASAGSSSKDLLELQSLLELELMVN